MLTGGTKLNNNIYKPTILLNPSQKSKVSNLEIFGPVICLYSYSNINDAIKLANSVDFSFQASVYSNNVNTANYITKNLEATTVMINDHTAFRIDSMPFSGRKLSGYGIGGIGYTMKDMLKYKMIISKNYYLNFYNKKIYYIIIIMLTLKVSLLKNFF